MNPLRQRSFPGGLAGRLTRAALTLENAFHEYRLGISTHGLYGFGQDDWKSEEHIYYGTASYRQIFHILDALHLGPWDTVIDLGCGKGRVTCCASLYGVAEVIGIEDTKELCEMAEENLRLMRGKHAPVTIIHGRAEEFEYVTRTVIYMFHPFGLKTLAAVLSQVETGLRRNPRPVRIVYVNPVHEGVLHGTNWLEQYDPWPANKRPWNGIGYSVSFWKLRTDKQGAAK